MGTDAHDAGPEGLERRGRRALMLMMLARRAGKGAADGHDAHDAGPEGWERKSRRPPMFMMLVRRAGKGEAGRR